MLIRTCGGGQTAALMLVASLLAPGVRAATADGTVFFPNPVQQLGNQTLTDQQGRRLPGVRRGVPAGAADQPRRLRHADRATTCVVKSKTGNAGPRGRRRLPGLAPRRRPVRAGHGLLLGDHRPGVPAAPRASASPLRPVNQRQIELRIDQYGGDNSFFREDKANITLGKGGVDDAEDAEVIVHEYGHSVQDGQVPGFGTNLESGSIGEAFSDYLAVVGHQLGHRRADADPRGVRRRLGLGVLHAVPCRTACAASTAPSTTPTTCVGEVHADGEIWSRALWDIRTALGDTTGQHADRRGAVRLRRRHQLRRCRHRHRGRRPAALRRRSRERRPARVRGPRHPLNRGGGCTEGWAITVPAVFE